jgi:C-terminal processing protease CtpA/Prc
LTVVRLACVVGFCILAAPWMAGPEFLDPRSLLSPLLLAAVVAGYVLPRLTALLPAFAAVSAAGWVAIAGPFRETLLGLEGFPSNDVLHGFLFLCFSLLLFDVSRSRHLASRPRPRWVPIGGRTFAYGVALPVVLFSLASFLLVNGATLRQAGLFLASLLFGATTADLLFRAGRAARPASAARRWLRWAVPGLILFPCVTFAAEWWAEREPAEQVPTRMSLAVGLYGDLSLLFPHWDAAPVGPDDLWQRYRPRLSAGDRACGESAEPCAPYLHALREMLAVLQNGHTGVVIEMEEGGFPLSVEPVEGKAAITYVEEGSAAEQAGLEPGMVILEVDGEPVEDLLRRTPSYRNPGASRRTREYDAYQALLDGIPGTTATLSLETDPGARRTVTLERERLELESIHDLDEGEAPLDFTRAKSGFVFATLSGFHGSDLETKLDLLMKELRGTKGLILDLRDNSGGDIELAMDLAGRFLPERVVVGSLCSASDASSDEPEISCDELAVEPHGNRYAGPVAVLTNGSTASAAEIAAYALCRTGRARCFGRPTAGETDTTEFTDLPGGYAQIGTGEFRPSFGPPIYGAGLDPDVPVAPTLKDYRLGVDPDRRAAREWLLGQDEGRAGETR